MPQTMKALVKKEPAKGIWMMQVPLPEVGRVVTVIPNHICPVVNLVDDVLVVRDGMSVDRWPVDARGRNG